MPGRWSLRPYTRAYKTFGQPTGSAGCTAFPFKRARYSAPRARPLPDRSRARTDRSPVAGADRAVPSPQPRRERYRGHARHRPRASSPRGGWRPRSSSPASSASGLGELQPGCPALRGGLDGGAAAHEAGPPTDELEPLLYHHVEPVHDHLGPSLDYMEPLPDDEVPDEESSGLGLWIAALCAGLATAVIVLVVIAANSDDGTDSKADAKTATTRPAAKTAAVGHQKSTGPPPGHGRALRDRLAAPARREGSGPPRAPGRHVLALALQLADEDAVRLQSTDEAGFDVKLLLPDGYGNYRFIDVSGEDDGEPRAHGRRASCGRRSRSSRRSEAQPDPHRGHRGGDGRRGRAVLARWRRRRGQRRWRQGDARRRRAP